MTHHRRRGESRPAAEFNMDETKQHIMAAGKELLLAARGALFFCKDYVEAQVPEAGRPNLLGFFQKAIAVADELSRGIAGVSTIKRTAAGIAKPLFTAMEREMREERQAGQRLAGRKPRRRSRKRRKP